MSRGFVFCFISRCLCWRFFMRLIQGECLIANATQVPLGQVVATPNALQTVPPESIQTALARHRAGDWGDCSLEDRQANDEALIHGGRLLSVYHTDDQIKFWIIPEADRSATTVLLPEDY